MTARPRHLAPVVALTLTGLLAACGGGGGSGERSGAGPEASTVTVTETAPTEGTDRPEQRQLTTAQITRALPTIDEAPDGFEPDPGGFDANRAPTRSTDPDVCRTIYLDTDEMRAWGKQHRRAAEGVRYTQAGDAAGRPSVSIYIVSYDEPVPKEHLDEAGATLGTCATFSEQISEGGRWTEKTASNISAPVVGDQSYAARVGLTELDLTVDHLWVRSGHNLISIRVLTGKGRLSDRTLEDLAEGVLEDLKTSG